MKNILILLLILISQGMISAQEKTLLNILNRELKHELKNNTNSQFLDGDIITVTKDFTIDSNKILSFEVKKTSLNFDGYLRIKQEVRLDQLKKIAKDIQIIFEAEKDAVITHYIYENDKNKNQIINDRFFYLFIVGQKQNEELGLSLQRALEKAGYFLQKESWYD